MTNKFDPAWKHGHVTRDGRKARIICRDFEHTYGPLAFAIMRKDGQEDIGVYSLEGTHPLLGDHWDLLNAPAPKRVWEGWAVLSLGAWTPAVFPDEQSAHAHADRMKTSFIAPVRIEFPEVTP